jgi:hypothetical protein
MRRATFSCSILLLLLLLLVGGCFESFQTDEGSTDEGVFFDAGPIRRDGGPIGRDAGRPARARQELDCAGGMERDVYVVSLDGADVGFCGTEPRGASLVFLLPGTFTGSNELPIEPGFVDAVRCEAGDCEVGSGGVLRALDIRRGRSARLEWDVSFGAVRESGAAVTDVWCDGGCGPEEPFRSGRAEPSCGPADGPAWRFELVREPFPGCDTELLGDRLVITLLDDLGPDDAGRIFEVGGVAVGPDSAFVQRCDAFGCSVLDVGDIELVAFEPGEVAILFYALDVPTGEFLIGEAEVPVFCEGIGPCG